MNIAKHRVRQTDQGNRIEILKRDPCIEEKLDLRQNGGKEELLFMLIYEKSFLCKKNYTLPTKINSGKIKDYERKA